MFGRSGTLADSRAKPLRVALLLIGVVALLTGTATALDQYIRLGPASDAHRAQLVAELNVLPAPLGATLLERSSNTKPGQALAEASFRGRFTFAELKAYYSPLLTEAGWSFLHDKSLGTVDLACYRRGDDSASVSKDRVGNEFAVTLFSGLQTCD